MTAPKWSVSTANGRYYYHPRRPKQVPSITNIMDQKNKPGLKFWAAGEAANYAADNLSKLSVLDRDEAVQLIKRAPFAKTDASLNGDVVHDWIDRYIKGDSIPPEEWKSATVTARHMYETFMAFNSHYQPTFKDAEFTVWSETYGYAGTGDWWGLIGGVPVLADTKTGARTYPDTGMQLAAIKNADFILDENGNEKEVPKFERFAILHLRPTFFKLQPVYNIDKCFQGFLGLKASFDLEVSYGDKILGYAPQIKTSTVKKGQ